MGLWPALCLWLTETSYMVSKDVKTTTSRLGPYSGKNCTFFMGGTRPALVSCHMIPQFEEIWIVTFVFLLCTWLHNLCICKLLSRFNKCNLSTQLCAKELIPCTRTYLQGTSGRSGTSPDFWGLLKELKVYSLWKGQRSLP